MTEKDQFGATDLQLFIWDRTHKITFENEQTYYNYKSFSLVNIC
jgi:hypothetical protein